MKNSMSLACPIAEKNSSSRHEKKVMHAVYRVVRENKNY